MWPFLLLLLLSAVVFVTSKPLEEESFYETMKPLVLPGKSAVQIIGMLENRVFSGAEKGGGWLMDMRFSFGSFVGGFPKDRSTPSPQKVVVIKNNVIVLYVNNHNFHFMYECIPLMYALQLNGIFASYPNATLLVTTHPGIQPQNLEILRILDIDLHSTNFMIARSGVRYEVDKSHVLVVSPKTRFISRHPDDPTIVKFLFSQIAEKAHSVLKQRGYNINPNPTEQIYLSREGYRRHAINESDLFPILQQHMNLKIVKHVEKMPMLDQWALFANASLIIAPHGGALTNELFCNPNVAVIELGTKRHGGSFSKWAGEWGIQKHHMMWVLAANAVSQTFDPNDQQYDLIFEPKVVAADILRYIKNFNHTLYV